MKNGKFGPGIPIKGCNLITNFLSSAGRNMWSPNSSRHFPHNTWKMGVTRNYRGSIRCVKRIDGRNTSFEDSSIRVWFCVWYNRRSDRWFTTTSPVRIDTQLITSGCLDNINSTGWEKYKYIYLVNWGFWSKSDGGDENEIHWLIQVDAF